MAAGDDGTGLVNLVIAAPQQSVDSFFGHIIGDTQQIQRQFRFAAHGINIGQGIGGGNLTEQIGVIHHGREEIHSLHQRQIVTYFIDGCIIAFIKTNQQVGIMMHLQPVQQLGQYTGTHLGTAAAAAGQLCQLHILFFHMLSSGNVPRLNEAGVFFITGVLRWSRNTESA